VLEIRDIVVQYGRIRALHGISLVVHEGELVTLLGSNGAGKTTTMRAISGLLPLTSGSVWFEGDDITKVKAHHRVIQGLVQAPEGRGVFPGMTVVENLEMGCYGRKFASKAEHNERLDWVLETFPRLAERRSQVGGTLSGGEQQMLGLSKGLILQPKLLLIDELSLGLAPVIVSQLLDMVREINATGTAVVLVEQSVNIALNLVDHAYFMEKGEIRFDGAARDLLGRDDLLRAVFLEGVAGR
jgi:branched-chain amino acid transport system ATP-binding protein